MVRGLIGFILLTAGVAFASGEAWQAPLSGMPLGDNVRELNRTNGVEIMLRAFQSNPVVKALIFMPGATDEFYMFRRVQAAVTGESPTLLDAVNALTNQTLIRVTFRPPFLLLHSDEDPIEPLITIADAPTAGRIREARFEPHALYNDRDWDFLLPVLKRNLKVKLFPGPRDVHSWHFYRHSFAAWNLSGWEALEAVSLAGKEIVTVERKRVVFEGDERARELPKF
jgi:hypothetical protein